jgi:hypothetical protein
MLYCIYIIVKRSYPALRVRVINCEIRIVIYTLFRLFGSECYRKKDWRKWGSITSIKNLETGSLEMRMIQELNV